MVPACEEAAGQSGKKAVFVISKAVPEDVSALAKMLEEGTARPVLDRRFSLDHAADAVRYVEEGKRRGKVVIDVEPAERR